MPAIVTALAVLTPLLPRIDPRGERYAAFAGTYHLFMNAIALFMTFTHLVTIAFTLGWALPVATTISVGVGLLLAVIGNELGRVQPNFFVGIRTPWTLADPEVWRRTHRVGGRAFVALVAAVVGGGAAGLVVFVFAYSYWAWRRLAGPAAR
jgi:uncharacterized membrane protein